MDDVAGARHGGPTPRIVAIVPAHDVDLVDVLVPELLGTADGAQLDIAVVVVPSSPAVRDEALDVALDDDRVTVASLPVIADGAAALGRAIATASERADVVVVLGGHGRNDAAELPALLQRLDDTGADLVVGSGLARAAAPGFVAMHAATAAALAPRVAAGVARIPLVATSLGMTVALVDVDDRDARAIDDTIDGWHDAHDRAVLALLDRRVLRILAAVGAGLVVVGVLVGLGSIVPLALGVGWLSWTLAGTAPVIVGVVLCATALGIDAVRVSTRERDAEPSRHGR